MSLLNPNRAVRRPRLAAMPRAGVFSEAQVRQVFDNFRSLLVDHMDGVYEIPQFVVLQSDLEVMRDALLMYCADNGASDRTLTEAVAPLELVFDHRRIANLPVAARQAYYLLPGVEDAVNDRIAALNAAQPPPAQPVPAFDATARPLQEPPAAVNWEVVVPYELPMNDLITCCRLNNTDGGVRRFCRYYAAFTAQLLEVNGHVPAWGMRHGVARAFAYRCGFDTADYIPDLNAAERDIIKRVKANVVRAAQNYDKRVTTDLGVANFPEPED